jgi:carbamoyl-phosphate synthase large subunit
VTKTTIGISGINATDNPGPGVAVARSLAETGIPADLIGLSYDVHDPGNYMTHLFANNFMMPFPTHGWDGMLASLYEIKHKTGLNVLIPCLDAELPLLIQNQNTLKAMGIETLLPSEEQFEFRSKDKLQALSQLIQCKHPKTEVVHSIDELISLLKNEQIALPAVVKGRYYKAYIVYNLETAILKGSEIAAEWGFPLLVQEQIHGQEINLIALSNRQGEVCSRVSIKKQLTTQLGKVWTAVTIRNEKLDELCDRFCRETKWAGPFELECICNEQGIYLIEINPRFPAWVYFATALGINMPKQLVDLITTGNCKKITEYPLGKYLVRHSAEFISDLSNFQNLLTKKNRRGI